jgi:predicted HicB family RNase H-like nuclease
MRIPKTPPKRAPKGSVDGGLLVLLSAELRKAIKAAAAKECLSMGEWVRRAAQERLAGKP